MSDFSRKVFTSNDITGIRAHVVDIKDRYAAYIDLPSICKYVPTTIRLLAVLERVLGQDVLKVFLKENATSVLSIAAIIIDDHCRHDDIQPKDLQVNLVVNFTVRAVRLVNLPKAKRFNYGENLIRACQFDPQFKLAIKRSLFDYNALNLPNLVIARYHANVPGDPGVWMDDPKEKRA